MKFPLFTLLFSLVLSIKPQAQTPSLTPLQTERLSKLSQLWGHVHFFHPHLAYKNLPWDSAFAEAVPLVIAAPDSVAYRNALQSLMASLNDPASIVQESGPMMETHFSEGERHPLARFDRDSLLVISLNNYHDMNDWEAAIGKFGEIAKLFPKAKGLIFDFRAKNSLGSMAGWAVDYAMSNSRLKYLLCDQPFITPGQRSRMHDGFAPEVGNSSGGYSSSFKVVDGSHVKPDKAAKALPIVFLINKDSYLPPEAVALQSAGKAAIIAQGEVTDALLAGALPMDMGEGVTMFFRVSEVLSANGVAGLVTNRSLPENADDAIALELAFEVLEKRDFSLPPATSPPPMVAAPQNGSFPIGNYPSLGYRVLGAAKVWSVIHYFFAYKDLMKSDWTEVLTNALPKVAAAKDSMEYTLAIAEQYSHLDDGHGFMNGGAIRDYFGQAKPPFVTRLVEGKPTLTAITVDSVCQKMGLEIGDVLTKVDGKLPKDELARIGHYLSASNENWRNFAANRYLLSGVNDTSIKTEWQGKNGKPKSVEIPLKTAYSQLFWTNVNERAATEVFKMLEGNIGYADLDRLSRDLVDSVMALFKDTKAIIFDMRGYPQGTAWSIAPYLTDQQNVVAANFQRYFAIQPSMNAADAIFADLKNGFKQTIPPPAKWKYKGKTVMLIDERSMSQSEHTGLFFEAANGTEFIGSQTAGANGDVTTFIIPGQIRLSFSGHDVRHADGRQLQQIGLVPKIEVRPSLAGIRAGKDEVLERAVRYLETGK